MTVNRRRRPVARFVALGAQDFQPRGEVAAGNRACAKRGKVSGFHLAVDYAESTPFEVGAQMGEGDFRRVARVGEH